eukprot:scaffold421358_cov61-Attheya_sp.AAC.2
MSESNVYSLSDNTSSQGKKDKSTCEDILEESSKLNPTKKLKLSHENLEYDGRQICKLIEYLDENEQFEVLPEDIEDFNDKESFRVLRSGRLTSDLAKKQCIIYGNEGLSMVLGVPIPPGSTFSATLSTWTNPCHSCYQICPPACFGVGLVPYGTAKEETWRRSDFQTTIEHGVQYYSEIKLPLGVNSFASLCAGVNMFEPTHTLDVREGGRTKRHVSGYQSKMTLEPISFRVVRDEAGDSELHIKHGQMSSIIDYHPSTSTKEDDKGESESSNDLQLYLNCLSWTDNMTYVRFEHVSLKHTKPVETGDSATLDNESSSSTTAKMNDKDDSTNYNELFQSNPELRMKVDAFIKGVQTNES